MITFLKYSNQPISLDLSPCLSLSLKANSSLPFFTYVNKLNFNIIKFILNKVWIPTAELCSSKQSCKLTDLKGEQSSSELTDRQLRQLGINPLTLIFMVSFLKPSYFEFND